MNSQYTSHKGTKNFLSNNIDFFIYKIKYSEVSMKRPLFSNTVSAGYPFYAEDNIEDFIDLNDYILSKKDDSFFLKVKGDSMMKAKIYEGDLLVIQKTNKPKNGDIVIAVIYGEITVKRIMIGKNRVFLKPENDAYPLIPICNENDLIILGIVTHIIHRVV